MHRQISPVGYLNPNEFLSDYYHSRKKINPGFSYQAWAVELSLRNRSYLRLVILGKKRITTNFIEGFRTSTAFDTDEKNYFVLLVRYHQAVDVSEKNLALNQMNKIIRARNPIESIELESNLVARPIFVRLLTILGFDDVMTTQKNLAELLNVETDEIGELLGKLESLKLAERRIENQSEIWKATKREFKITEHIGDNGLIRFHELSLSDAQKAMNGDFQSRRCRSLILAMSNDQLEDFKQRLNDFALSTFAAYASDSYSGKRLFQINFNFHPIAAEQSLAANSANETLGP